MTRTHLGHGYVAAMGLLGVASAIAAAGLGYLLRLGTGERSEDIALAFLFTGAVLVAAYCVYVIAGYRSKIVIYGRGGLHVGPESAPWIPWTRVARIYQHPI